MVSGKLDRLCTIDGQSPGGVQMVVRGISRMAQTASVPSTVTVVLVKGKLVRDIVRVQTRDRINRVAINSDAGCCGSGIGG